MICLVLIPALSWGETIRITNGEWAPYLSQKLPRHGAASHIVSEAFAAVDIKTEYGFYPWKRSYRLARDGIWNGTVVWVFTEERAQDFIYSDVVIEDSEYLFHLKINPLQWSKIEDLRGMTIGTTLHTVHPRLEQAHSSGILNLQRAGNYDNLYNRLMKNRIDAIPNVLQVGLFLLRTTLSPKERESITYSPTELKSRKYHLILSKKIPDNWRLVQLFNTGLERIRKNGVYADILDDLEKGAYDPIVAKRRLP